ncbi:TRAP transporter small permease subunit [Azospirillum rugosum]|uniref:TRAP transporter small permease protein n=1 Tax=Azospirillum rugosum TaxID=416170 RepID=A0ABS4SPE8_9PROT|nr:TRAP transporter small permease subunit [Azospirillum rugosum]MBP2294438.1 TRAP-type mannitol/chloroaromatic compound transport system permease small subunit [Azospirillum rugosum]MDQ0528943.1 TRAP-type mannitol/chloroaromatic compound transport system permease small subunit [Azospirillum rugosum]
MRFLLRISGLIDAVNDGIGKLVYWLVLAAVVVSSVNAVVRYSINYSSNAWLELQWYLFAAIFLLCSGYTFLRNEHIRIDIILGRFSKRVQAAVDIFGILVFLFPMAILIMWLSWPMFRDSFVTNEMSSDAGGLIRWPAKLLVPVGFFLLTAQGLSELIKRIAFLAGVIDQPGEKMHSH